MTHPVLDWLQHEVKPQVDRRIKAALQDSSYQEELWYQLSTGGKRWRPGLALLIGKLCGSEEGELLDVAAGIELLHTFTLIHDDILDGDAYRRDQPAMWAQYDTATAINIGDMMNAKALSLFPPSTVGRAHDTLLQITEGQQMDLDFETRRDVTVEEYLEMGQKNTGVLLDLCLEAPQTMTGAELDIGDYSLLGLAFRIRDDLLDFEAGKGKQHIGSEVRTGKRTLMVIHADDDQLYDILDKPREETTEHDVQQARQIMRDHNSMHFARTKMNDFAEDALSSLSNLPESPERERLRDLGSFLIERSQ